jgi:hypothetical protein
VENSNPAKAATSKLSVKPDPDTKRDCEDEGVPTVVIKVVNEPDTLINEVTVPLTDL